MRRGGTAAIVLAAGAGTRMRSALPKVLHPLAGRSLVEHAVLATVALDPAELLVVVGHGREQVEHRLATLSATLGRPVHTAVQTEQRGTGHAVRCGLDGLVAAGRELPDTVLVSYGDVPLLDGATLTALLDEHRQHRRAVTVLSARVTDPSGYGRIVRDADGAVTGIVEHRDATADQRAIDEINSGVGVFDTDVLLDALARLGTANSQGELYLTDVLGLAGADGRAVGAAVCTDPWLVEGVNDRVQLAELGVELNRRLLHRAMRAGVTVVDPGSVWLDADVELGIDVTLRPGVQLLAGTRVGDGAVIGPDTTLQGCVVAAGSSVVRSHAVDAHIGPGAVVGPFSHLRPGTVVGERAKVGAYVETKNADIGAGAKLPHLSYVGDATVGPGANIGAASVTVNYDGVAKHHTTIGAHARIGSDTMLVAPVTVGDGAYTAAGSVILDDVPPGALGVARGRQRNVEGWVGHRRPGTPAAVAAERATVRAGIDAPDESNRTQEHA